MLHAVAFYVLSFFILGFAVLVISTRNTVHSVLYLVLNFLAIAALYVLLTAQFLAVIQVLVYAGGIVVLYLFVVMLVNLKRPPEDHAAATAGLDLLALAGVVLAGWEVFITCIAPNLVRTYDLAINNVERIGALHRASLFSGAGFVAAGGREFGETGP
jgi:NADH-quinone oxidoreductase subunit J